MNDADGDVQQEEGHNDVDCAIIETDGEFDEETTIDPSSQHRIKKFNIFPAQQQPNSFFLSLYQVVTMPLAGSYGKPLAYEVRYENLIDRINLEFKIFGISDDYCRDAELFCGNFSSSSPWYF
ncbi:hypothetical protein M9H77_17435 [Catharanthus roseus]|uniref:Uncharacterized protein n=1 Tax=Catharanthus roseus TaxID=4058 RepID=A0ACC0B4U4_CATRO|nr:hypothetical protein M9H77_17435 [Catharanthus roseus]